VSQLLTVQKILDCPDCMKHYYSPECEFLPMAAASVGIEHGKSTQRMLLEYLASYHRNDHSETLRGD
jgi:hypothetical protein